MDREAMKQPEALRLADALDDESTQGRISNYNGRKAAVELRRLHERCEQWRDIHDAVVADSDKVYALLRQALEAGLCYGSDEKPLGSVTRFAALVAAAEREKVAQWMMAQGYSTGHGDSTEDLLKELEWQIEERIGNEREMCAKVCDVLAVHPEYASDITKVTAQAIRARGEK